MVRVWVILGKVLFCRVGLGFNHGDSVPGLGQNCQNLYNFVSDPR